MPHTHTHQLIVCRQPDFIRFMARFIEICDLDNPKGRGGGGGGGGWPTVYIYIYKYISEPEDESSSEELPSLREYLSLMTAT